MQGCQQQVLRSSCVSYYYNPPTVQIEIAHVAVSRSAKPSRMRQATLGKLRAQYAAATRDWNAKNGRLSVERDSVVREHVSLKAGLGSFRATQALRLKQLSVWR